MPTSVDRFEATATSELTGSLRPLAKQQAALQRWLELNGATLSTPLSTRPGTHIQTEIVHKIPANEKVATLRNALAANGLAIAPGIHQLPALHKVVRVEDLLRTEA